MAGNSFGDLLRITTFGESHGEAIGVVLDGFPAGIKIDIDFIQAEMTRRRPGQSTITTSRNENDTVKILSGVYNGISLGSPIALLIHNSDQRSEDYTAMEHIFRPSHADITYQQKYGIRDPRGGGRSSARETACRVAAGAFAKLFLQQYGIEIQAFVKQIGAVVLQKTYREIDYDGIEKNIVRCPEEATANAMIALINKVKEAGDSVGGVVQCVLKNCPAGLGEPIYDKLQANLAKAMLSINAAKGFEYGEGFASAAMKGSEHNDAILPDGFATNHSGGILGGISNGDTIYFNVAFKPVATIAQQQTTINDQNEAVTLSASGRHDPCVVPRAVAIVEAMAALVLADFVLKKNSYQL